MIESIKTRALISVESHGITIRGTLHRPPGQSCDSNSIDETQNVGILILNSLSLPRSSTGDSAAFWADSFAALGYPTVRIDLPGLGDSDGEIPDDLLGFINSGGYAEIVSSALKQITERFDLTGTIVIGQCAGSVSALYAAASSNCNGLVLMDPYFYLPPVVKHSEVWKRLSNTVSRRGLGIRFRNIYQVIEGAWASLRRNKLPKNANTALLQIWKDVAPRRLPILVLKSPNLTKIRAKQRMMEFDYFRYMMKVAGRRNRVSILTVEGTDHSFANRAGQDAVRANIKGWLSIHFPLVGGGVPVTRTVLERAKHESAGRFIPYVPES